MVRVIGVGNELRGDDAAGLETVRRLRARALPGVEAVACAADPLALFEAWGGAEDVVVVDAMHSGAPRGTVAHFDAARGPLPIDSLRGSTHGLGVAAAVELARALGTLPTRLELVGFEGASWDHSAALSPEVSAAIERWIDHLAAGAETACPIAASPPQGPAGGHVTRPVDGHATTA